MDNQLRWESVLRGFRQQEGPDSRWKNQEFEEKEKVPDTNLRVSIVVLLRESAPSPCRHRSPVLGTHRIS